MFSNEERRLIGEKARAFGLPEAHVLAVTEVESAGQTFAEVNGRKEPLIRFEGHIFLRRLTGRERELAEAEGLASSKVGGVKNPSSQKARWDLLKRAMKIDAQAALESTSWGVGQVMGMHWEALGFDGVKAFVEEVRSGLEGQVEVMLRFVRMAGLADELREGQWAPFARGYNGPGYKANSYDTRMAAAAAKFGGAISEPKGFLRMGAKGARVREVQALLQRGGYAVTLDGDFGPSTKTALQAFQRARGLKADGIYGPATERALGALRQAADDVPGKARPIDIASVRKGGTAMGSGVALAAAQEKLQDVSSTIAGLGVSPRLLDCIQTGLTVGIAALVLGGLAWGAYGYLRSRRTVEA